MKLIALGLAGALAACASTYVAGPNDPVDMAAELGNRARSYVGMGEACDAAAGGGHRAAVVQTVRMQQQRLDVLAGLVNRAYQGRATPEYTARIQSEARARGITSSQVCDGFVSHAQTELGQRATHILMMQTQPDLADYVRQAQQPNS